ncbi:MAG: hypothetical protein U0Q21_13960 [Dermatophilaceae bacterium]
MVDRPESTGARLARGCVRTLGVLVALVVLAYLGVNAVAWSQASGRKAEARRATTAAIARTLPGLRATQEHVQASLGTPARSWLAQECGVGSRDAGWMVQSYQSGCTLVAVEMYAVPSSPAARALVATAPVAVVGDAVPAAEGDVGGCRRLAGRAPNLIAEPDAVTIETTYVPRRPAGDDLWCGTYVAGADWQARRMVAGRWAAPEGNRSWLVVRHTVGLGTADVGCLHWSVLFCDAPSGIPVFGDLPAS